MTSSTPWSQEEQAQLRTALSLIESVPARAEVPSVELEPILTRFRIRGNAAGLKQLAVRNLRAALGEEVASTQSPDISAWVIFDDYRWATSDLLRSEQTLASMATRYTLSSNRKIRNKARFYRSMPWFVLGLLTTPAIYFMIAAVGFILGSFGMDIHLTR